MIKTLIIITFFIIYILPCFAQNEEHEHLTINNRKYYEDYGKGKNLVLDFYQKWISPVRGYNKCPMYPSCSQYAKIAFDVLPWYKAYPKSLERLARCGNELHLYPTIQLNDKLRWYDPVIGNQSKYKDRFFNGRSKTYYKSESTDSTISENLNVNNDGFAEYLFRNGEYSRAITENYRLAYTTSDSNIKVHLYRNIGLCYFQESNYNGYISFVNKHNFYFSSNPNIRAEITLLLAKSYYHLNNYQKAISTLEWSRDGQNSLFFNENNFVSGISYARIFDWQKAIEKLEIITTDYPGKAKSERIVLSLKNYHKLPQKNTTIAGIFSAVIPGSGYFYCNRKGTAISSFILNGLFALTIREAIIKENYWLAGTISFLGIGWYIGNIKGSIDAARHYNTITRHKFIDKILEETDYSEYMKK